MFLIMGSKNNNKKIELTTWGRIIPWALTVSCLVVLAIIGNFLIENIEWYKNTVFNTRLDPIQVPIYKIHAYHIHVSMIKRSVGLFSGFAIMFLGLGVAFFSLRNRTDAEMKSDLWTLKVATASPGIIALLIGGIITMYTVGSKDNFAPYPLVKRKVPASSNFEKDTTNSDTVVIPSPFN